MSAPAPVHATVRAIAYLRGVSDPVIKQMNVCTPACGAAIDNLREFGWADAEALIDGGPPGERATCGRCLVLIDQALEQRPLWVSP